jgi:hypothetical protein
VGDASWQVLTIMTGDGTRRGCFACRGRGALIRSPLFVTDAFATMRTKGRINPENSLSHEPPHTDTWTQA